MNRTGRWWIAGGALAIIVAIVVLVTASHRPPGDAIANGSATPSTPLVTATFGTFVERVSAQGRVGPPAGSSAKIAFAQAGILRSVDVHVGESVSAGQVVAELDRAALGAALSSAQADVQATGANGAAIATVVSANARLTVALGKLATLEAGGPAALNTRIAAQSAARQAALKVETDRATVARDGQLLAAGVIAGKDADAAQAQLASDEADQRAADAKVAAAGTDFQAALQQARADVAGARSDVESARGQASSVQARLQGAHIAFSNGLLTAPSSGIVLAILKHPGEAVDPSSPAIEIGPALGHAVTLSVPADVARRIAVGNAVTLRDSGRTGAAAGSVIAVVPAVDPSTQVATVVVNGALDGAVAGDAISAIIVVGQRRGVLVPSTAIVEDPQTGKTVVFVHNAQPKSGDSAFTMREVSVGASDTATSLIATGLQAGERIAASGGYMLLAPAGG
jgi:multidrug efflux pump subunit AcrA (membrane-fusion protein)